MPLDQPYPELDELLAGIGEAGKRVSGINASEGAAGNISVFIGWPLEIRRRFPIAEPFTLPSAAPALAGGLVIVTGSGRRLREIHHDPVKNLGVVAIGPDGTSAQLFIAPGRLFQRPTSEFNSHLAVHQDEAERTGTNFHALIHAQPPHLVYLSHIPAYRDQAYINQRLLRWEPETIINLPAGVGVLLYCLPGSPAMMEANVAGLRQYNAAPRDSRPRRPGVSCCGRHARHDQRVLPAHPSARARGRRRGRALLPGKPGAEVPLGRRGSGGANGPTD
jgi:rhamnulose-1-phosphate aldolase